MIGLTQGTTYTAYLKGPAQLVKAQTFVMSPTGASLNGGAPITLVTGDLNQDNMVDGSDQEIEQQLLGTTSKSPNWNPLADFNLDGTVNVFDLSLIKKNLNQVGDSGKWYSRVDSASSSASLSTPSIGGADATPSVTPNGSTSGHWVWVPDLSH